MTAPTPDEAAPRPMTAARVLLLRRLEIPVDDDLAVLDVVDNLLAERDALRARVAAARPVLDAASTVLGGWNSGTWSCGAIGDGLMEALHDTFVEYRAALGSAEAGAPAAEPAPGRVRIAAIIGPAMGHEEFEDFPDCTQELCTHEGGHPAEAGCDACAGPGWPCDVALAAADAVLAALAGAGAPEPAQDDERGYIVARFRDAADQHGDRTLDYWDDDVHATAGGACNHYVEHVDDEHGGWEVYELRRLPNPRAALAAGVRQEARDA